MCACVSLIALVQGQCLQATDLKSIAVIKWTVGCVGHYLSMNFTLLLEEDVRLGGQRQNVSYHRDGRWTRRKARGSSLLDELANQQEGEKGDSQAEHTEQSLSPRHRHQTRRFNWNHLFQRIKSVFPAGLPPLTSASPQSNWSTYVSSCTFSIPRLLG